MVEVVRQLADRDAVEPGEELLHVLHALVALLRKDADLDAVAGGEDHPFRDAVALPQPPEGVPHRVRRNARRSRTSTGAVRWFKPTMTISLMRSFAVPSAGKVRVGVQPRQEKVHAEEGEQDRAEPDDGEDRRLAPAPADGHPPVEQRSVEQPRDEDQTSFGSQLQ